MTGTDPRPAATLRPALRLSADSAGGTAPSRSRGDALRQRQSGCRRPWVRERGEDDPDVLAALGLPPGRAPCPAPFHRIFKARDVVAFEQAEGQWLQATGVSPTDMLAVDGTAPRGVARSGVPAVYLVGVYAHRAKTAIAQLRTEGKRHELSAARKVLTHTPVTGRVVMGDALLTDRALCTQIM
jgi:hypothetical protein